MAGFVGSCSFLRHQVPDGVMGSLLDCYSRPWPTMGGGSTERHGPAASGLVHRHGRSWMELGEGVRVPSQDGEPGKPRASAAVDLARVERESRSPRLFPPRIYELTRTMLDYAAHGQPDRLAVRLREENQKTCQLVLDQCVVVAHCIVNGRSATWPPSEADLRMLAAITSSCTESPEPTAAIADPVVYNFLSRAVVLGERIDDVIGTEDPAVLTVRITAAMLVAFLPGRPWQGHLELIWKLETDDGVNCTALRSAARRFRRTSVTPMPEADS